jgi:hypothetical protein
LNPNTKALFDACQRNSEDCEYTALNFVIWLRYLRWFRVAFLTLPVIFGAVATWKIAERAAPIGTAFCTLLATTLPLIYRATKLDDTIRKYERRAGQFTNLRDDFRRIAEIGINKDFAAFEKDSKPLFARLRKAREPMLTPPEWCFAIAQRKIQGGHYHHDYDIRGLGAKDAS